MTPFHLFIITIVSFALIIALILACRNSEWEAPSLAKNATVGQETRQEYAERLLAKLSNESDRVYYQGILKDLDEKEAYFDEQERLNRERQEITQKLDTDALEASLQDEIKPLQYSEYLQVAAEDESDTRPASPPLSNAELSAIAYLEDLEG